MHTSQRFWTICRKLLPPLTAYYRTRHQPEAVEARRARERVRLALQELGTTFIKLGQLLSARPDLVGLELAAELRNLLDHEPPIAFASIQRVIEAEINAPIHHVFKHIDSRPIGTASIAQVHRAELFNGQQVALKVQRPDVDAVIQQDLPVLKKVCQLLEKLTPSRSIKFTYLYGEFVDWITNELDFRVEGRRADKFRANMHDIEGIVIPQVYWPHTSRRLLVMSFLEGYTLNQLLDIMKVQGAASLYDIKLDYAVDPDVLIQRTVAAVARQALVDRYFHGDLHPANIIVQRHNKVAFLDFGIIGTINTEEHAQIMLTLLAIVQNDPEALLKVAKSLAVQNMPPEAVADIHQRLSDELHKLQEDGNGRISLNHFLSVLFGISQQYTLSFTQGFIVAIKTIAQIDSVAGQIGLREPLIAYMKPEVERCVTQSLSLEVSKENLSSAMLNLVDAGKQLPQTIHDVEDLLHSGELVGPKPGNYPVRRLAAKGLTYGAILMAMAAWVGLMVWYSPAYLRPAVLAALSPLCLLFLLATMLRSERE